MKSGARVAVDWKQLPIPPQVGWPRCDDLTCEHAADGVAVVGHLERPETLIADVERLGRKRGLAQRTPEAGDVAHDRRRPRARIGRHRGRCA